MPLNLEDVSPRENPWFSANVEYNGTGRADFANHRGAAEGVVSVVFDEFGGTKIQMEVERLTGPEPQPKEIMELVASRRFPEPGGGMILYHGLRDNPCTQVTVDTGAGVFSSAGQIDYDVRLGADRDRLSLRPWVSQFDSKEAGRAKYWVVPLLNFVSDFCSWPGELSGHPLRVSSTPAIPDGLPQDEALEALSYAGSQNHLIVFTFNGSPGFVEPLPDYADRKAKLNAGSVHRLVTAVMVGEVGDNSIEVKSLAGWFPYDLLRVLSFATGTEVGAPWIEFRDESCRLIRRVHQLHDGADYTEGPRVIREGIHKGTGKLLTSYLSSQDPCRSYLPVAMKHARQGWGHSGSSIEEKLIYVIRGLDCLCSRVSPTEPDLRMRLRPEKRELVRETLHEAARRIRSLAASPSTFAEEGEMSALHEIAERTLTAPWGKAGTFGLAVVDLLNKLGLADAVVLDAHFASASAPGTATESWASRLSRIRGEPIHAGFFDIKRGEFRIEELLTLTRHLHDVLVRAILKIIKYEGTYQPTVFTGAVQAPVGWVRTSTAARDLGYS
jgi:hypothetical protein